MLFTGVRDGMSVNDLVAVMLLWSLPHYHHEQSQYLFVEKPLAADRRISLTAPVPCMPGGPRTT